MDSLHIPWLTLGFVWTLNFCISWWNAYAVGVNWVESKQMGGLQRLMAWAGAVMSASGFSWCLMMVLTFGFYFGQFHFMAPDHAPYLSVKGVEAAFSLWYVIMIPGILISGLLIWLDSVVQAWRRRDFSSIGTAAWNTFAQAHNTYSAFSGFGGALDSIGGFFGKSDDDEGDGKGLMILIVLLLVVFAIAGGILITWGLISHYAGTRPMPDMREIPRQKKQYA